MRFRDFFLKQEPLGEEFESTLYDNLWELYEGGNALKNVSKITQTEVRDTTPDLLKKIQKALGLKSGQVKLIGSGGKKPNDDDLSSDLDVAVETTPENVQEHLSELASGGISRVMKGINVYSFAHDLGNKLVQVDLIPVNNINFAEWSYQANEKDLADGLKGAHRNELFFAIAKYMPQKITKKDAAGEPLTLHRNFYDLSRGLMTGVKTRVKENGKVVKNFTTKDKKVVTDDPVKVVKLMFGDHVTPEQASTFEGTLEAIRSPEFINRDKVIDIVKQASEGIKNKGLKVPSSLN